MTPSTEIPLENPTTSNVDRAFLENSGSKDRGKHILLSGLLYSLIVDCVNNGEKKDIEIYLQLSFPSLSVPCCAAKC
jgi:hypothetical protein